MRLQCSDETVAVIEDLLAALIGVGVEVLRVLGQGAHALGDGSGFLPLLAQQGIHARADLLPLLEPELMHLIRAHVGGDRLAQRDRVQRSALRQAAHASLVHGTGAQLTQGLHLPVQRRKDFLSDEACGIRAVATLQAELLRALRDRSREDRISRRRAPQGVHLFQRALDKEVRRRDLQSRIVPHALGFLLEHRGKGAQACQVRLGVLLVLDLMLPVEKGRDALISPRQLADHVRAHCVAVLEGLGACDRLHLELDRVIVDQVRAGQGAATEGSQALQARGVLLLGLAHPLERSFGELRPGPRVLALVEPEARQLLGIFRQPLVHEDIEQRVEALGGLARGRSKGPSQRCRDARGDQRTGNGNKLTTVDHETLPGVRTAPAPARTCGRQRRFRVTAASRPAGRASSSRQRAFLLGAVGGDQVHQGR